ncbi:MAG TPA: glycosyltransferase family 4 protein [Bryobacteraceae bacterium]|nr:glycosyltransferase family 4 protein [Bryobacteraceae bacterium]
MTADAAGGVWNYALELAHGFAERGVETTLVVFGPEPPPAPGIDVRHRSYKLEWMEDPWDDVYRSGDWLLELESEIGPDVIHLNGYAYGDVPFFAPKLVVAHSCVVSWWRAVHGCAAPPAWDEYRRRVTRGLRQADLIVAVSRAMRNELACHDDCAVQVIPNGRDPRRFRCAPKENFIFASGRLWDQAKNIQLLDRIAPSLPWPIYAAGDGGKFSNLAALGGLSGEEIAEWFARAAIYAHPARYEPFGLSVLEAALSGCALVLGDIPSLRENWDGAALFAPPDSPGEFAGRLQVLVESELLRKQFQESARKRAKFFHASKMVNAYLDAYGWLRSQSSATFKSFTNPRYSRSRSESWLNQ